MITRGLGHFQQFLWMIIIQNLNFTIANYKPLRSLVLQGFISMTGEGWPGGGACVPAVKLALRHVNEYAGLLDDYNLTFTWEDSQCDPGVAPYRMFETLSQPPTKIMLLGCTCSIGTVATAQISHRFNLTQISAASSSPALSDRVRFPNLFRLMGPDHKQNPAKIAMMKEFNWKKVATINQAFEIFSKVTDDFVQSLKGTDVTIISQEIFQHDPYSRVANLKKHDARIIMTACYEDKARLLLCAAYRLGLYGPKIVWMFLHWYSWGFWRLDLEDVPCTEHELTLAVEGAFLFGFAYTHNKTSIAGITEFDVQYRQESTYDAIYKPYELVRTLYYDYIWVAALALNCTDAYLRSIGHPKKLDEFTYEDSDMNDIIMSCMSNVSFTGISGNIAFDQGSDPIKDVTIERIEDGQRVLVGQYILEHEPAHLVWKGGGIKWKDGNIPRDSTYLIHEEIVIPVWLYVTMTSLAGTGILVAVSLFVFNVKNRQNRIVKLSSPNINNVLLLGCVLTYSTVFMKTTVQDMNGALCKIRILCFSLGFTTAFGALFSKTWRVYKIFTNKKLMQVRIRDAQLIGIVLVMNIVIVAIVIVWESTGPHTVVEKESAKDVYLIGNDAEVRPFVRMCHSIYDVYFSWTIYITEGALLAFGAFLAWETRHVKIEALNDSRQIGLCLYNVVVLSAVGLTFTLILEGSVVLIYGIISGCVIIATTLTQAIVFVPKVMAVYGHYPTNSVEGAVGSGNVMSTTLNLDTTVQNSCS